MSAFSRRKFLKTSLAVGAVGTAGTLPLHAAAPKATDIVTLGKSGMNVTRLAFGTGSNNGYVQAKLGQQEFTRLIHYAYDRGIRFFETAESYVTPAMLGEALKPFARDSYQLMTKVTTDEGVDPAKRFDEMRRTSQTEYFDIMLLHWQHNADWVAETSRWQDGVLEAQSKKTIRTRGASVHGLPALRQMPGNKWLEVAMIRMNHNGTRMDGPSYNDNDNPDHVSDGRDQHEAHRQRQLHAPRRPPGRNALCVQECRHRLCHGWIQEHAGDRRSDRQHESCAGLASCV
jgi:hypothetical protein